MAIEKYNTGLATDNAVALIRAVAAAAPHLHTLMLTTATPFSPDDLALWGTLITWLRTTPNRVRVVKFCVHGKRFKENELQPLAALCGGWLRLQY